MAYQDLNTYNVSSGIHVLFQASSDAAPILVPLILFGFFIIIFSSSYFATRRLLGRDKIMPPFAAAAYATTVLSFIMTLIPNFINTATNVICVVISIVATLGLFMSERG